MNHSKCHEYSWCYNNVCVCVFSSCEWGETFYQRNERQGKRSMCNQSEFIYLMFVKFGKPKRLIEDLIFTMNLKVVLDLNKMCVLNNKNALAVIMLLPWVLTQ